MIKKIEMAVRALPGHQGRGQRSFWGNHRLAGSAGGWVDPFCGLISERGVAFPLVHRPHCHKHLILSLVFLKKYGYL